jgi:hypothetical protein
VSPRRYFGWEPREFHSYEFAPVVWWKPWTWNRVTGVAVVREAEFGRWDRALLEAHKIDVADIGPHGVPMSEATDKENQFAYTATSAPLVDWAARAIGTAQDTYYEKNPKVSRHGHIWRLRPRASEGTPPVRYG